MHKVIKIKVKILNQGKVICLEAFTFFQNPHGRGLITSSLGLLITKKLKHMK